jgi:hypothetical protein
MRKRKRDDGGSSAAPAGGTTTFAESQLAKFGWIKGHGLGKNKQGMTKAIKVGHKQDTLGLGKDADQWTVQWWDHVYNKTSASLAVKQTAEGTVTISSKPLTAKEKKEANLSLLYRNFVPAKATAFDPSKLVSDPSNAILDIDDEEKYRTKITDKELFEACGGLTAHKGARSATAAKGKLARVDAGKLLGKEDSSSEDEFEVRARMVAEGFSGPAPPRKGKRGEDEAVKKEKREENDSNSVPEKWARPPPSPPPSNTDDVVERKSRKKDETPEERAERKRKRKEEKRRRRKAAVEAAGEAEEDEEAKPRETKEERRCRKKEGKKKRRDGQDEDGSD